MTMIQRALCVVAGVDRNTLATCPATDKMWATQLGLSLLISFLVVLGISFHATGYMIENVWLRLLTSAIVALTVFMFDRALYQSDWFSQASVQTSAADQNGKAEATPPRFQRLLRVGIRLGISVVLAWIIAVFLELAIFSDTINEKIRRDYLTANQGVFEKIDRYEAQIDAGIAQRRAALAALEAQYAAELAAPQAPPPSSMVEAAADADRQLKEIGQREQSLRAELREIETALVRHSEEMNAEELGLKLRADQSGRAGLGPRYRFARQQRDIQQALRTTRESELTQLTAERDRMRAEQARLTGELSTRPDQARLDARREGLRNQIEAAKAELTALESTRAARITEFRTQIFASSEYRPQRNDPLSRMTAYQELKSDPRDGATITLFSWMTKAFVIFLEIAPVLAKMFFAPPSVYGARIQAQVAQGRLQAQREVERLELERQEVARQELVRQELARQELAQQEADLNVPLAMIEPEQDDPFAFRHEVSADPIDVLERELHVQRGKGSQKGSQRPAAARGFAELALGERKPA